MCPRADDESALGSSLEHGPDIISASGDAAENGLNLNPPCLKKPFWDVHAIPIARAPAPQVRRADIVLSGQSQPLDFPFDSDASSMLAPDSVRRLADHFCDPKVGAVSGVYRLLKKDEADLGSQEDFYWKHETFLKVREARLGAFTGAHGSLYAIRRALYAVCDLQRICPARGEVLRLR